MEDRTYHTYVNFGQVPLPHGVIAVNSDNGSRELKAMFKKMEDATAYIKDRNDETFGAF